VTELDRVTQQNAALVEESAAASESLKQQALRLAPERGRLPLDHTTLEAKAALPAASRAPALPQAAGKQDDWKQF
jgi:methyl-accepting chemotaxis protein